MADKENPIMRGHKYLKKNHPLAYEAAQLFTPIGVGAAALEGVDAIKAGDTEELVKAALSAVPVSKVSRIGNRLARTFREAVDGSSTSQRIANGVRKAGAGENVAEAGEAGYDQGLLSKQNNGFKKGGKVKGWGKARGARAAKII